MTRTSASLSLPLLVLLALLPDAAVSADSGSWSDRFYVDGPDGAVSTMLVHDDALFVGGDFSSIGPTLARRVARFDGSEWSALGEGVGGRVHVLAEYQGDLIAGGSFQEAGGVPASNIARWDGTAWRPLGDGTTFSVHSLTVFDGDLIAGGTIGFAGGISACSVARWDGASWHAMGDVFHDIVRCLAVYQGELYAGSAAHFEDEGESRIAFVWHWDGSAWAPLTSSDLYCTVIGRSDILALQVMNDRLYAVGMCMAVDDHGHGTLCFWDGADWSNVPRGWTDYRYEEEWPSTILQHEGKLIVGGTFWGLGGGISHSLSIYDGSEWAPLPGGGLQCDDLSVGPTVSAMAEYKGYVYVAGDFPGVGGLTAPLLARWDGAEWSAVAVGGLGIVGTVLAETFWGDRLVAGGRFSLAGGQPANNIAVLDQGRWEPMGPGLNGSVSALVPYGDGVVAAGTFSKSGDLPVSMVAYWDGSSWSALGPGLQGQDVAALAVYEGDLIAGGRFEAARGTPSLCVERWDGATWSPMGDELNDAVLSLEVHEGTLFAAGDFDGHAVWWDGERWWRAGQGFSSQMNSLQSTPDGLYAGGVAGVWRWNDDRWAPIAFPVGRIRCLGSHKGDLIAGGGLRPSPDWMWTGVGLLRWNGSDWLAVEDGPQRGVYAIATNGFDLAAGGTFTSTGEAAAWGVALWQEVEHPEDYPMAPESFTALRSGPSVRISCEMAHGEEARSYNLYREAAEEGRTILTATPLVDHRSYEFTDSLSPLGALDYWMEQVLGNGDHVAWFGPVHVPSTSELWTLRDIRISPNPARGLVRLAFDLPTSVPTRIDVFDLSGRNVATLKNGPLGPGACSVEWNGQVGEGQRLASGTYWISLEAGRESRRASFMWIR